MDDITLHVLHGLPSEYNGIADALRTRDTSVSFDELYEKLVDYEAYLQCKSISVSDSVTVNAVTCANNSFATRTNKNPRLPMAKDFSTGAPLVTGKPKDGVYEWPLQHCSFSSNKDPSSSKIFVSRHVDFVEDQFPFAQLTCFQPRVHENVVQDVFLTMCCLFLVRYHLFWPAPTPSLSTVVPRGINNSSDTTEQYIEDIVDRTLMTGAKPVPTPLAYLGLTRPDIAFAVNKLAQFSTTPTVNHWAIVKRVIRYLIGTIDKGCHLSSSWSPAGDDSQPYLEADWRSFRARLVANEQAFWLNTAPSSMDPDSVVEVDHPLQVAIGCKWAHAIHEPEKGCLLIATEKLDGVHIFERTVILLLSVGPAGPYGIILNRPSLMSIKEMRSTVLDAAGMFSERRLFFGGPLEEGLFLVSPKRGYDNDMVAKSGVFEQVMKGLYHGTKESVGCATEMVKRNVVGIGDFRFFDGYCVWEKKQLREEIMAGYWTVAACSPSVIGLQNVGTHGSGRRSSGSWAQKSLVTTY
ncbi:hypothetical protein GH714_012223 [Hevea brasiliensis]|uniref:Uncharacterized protein n=1 Tax=Hevea brasiliensis TaxID=3981 RepID=A0A6A6MIL1_HEVBR|nr:hypothetical protein GH714_012223 [Hevea brasiliensis]